MSAATSKPITGQHKSAAPFGAVALLAGVVALGAIGIAYGQTVKTAVPGAHPAPARIIDRTDSAPVVRPVGREDLFAGRASNLDMIKSESLLANRYGPAVNLDLIQNEALLANRYAAPYVNPGVIMAERVVNFYSPSAGPQVSTAAPAEPLRPHLPRRPVIR